MSEFISRKRFVEPKVIIEQYNLSPSKVYEMLKKKEFSEAVVTIGKNKRVDQDKFYEIITQIYR